MSEEPREGTGEAAETEAGEEVAKTEAEVKAEAKAKAKAEEKAAKALEAAMAEKGTEVAYKLDQMITDAVTELGIVLDIEKRKEISRRLEELFGIESEE